MNRAIVTVATTARYQRGQARLKESAREFGYCSVVAFDQLPDGCPRHVPFAFKPWALKAAQEMGAESVLWCDSSIAVVRDLRPLWERIERHGHWMSNNGFTNYEWTADSAYPHLLPELPQLEWARKTNRGISHVVAGCFGLNLRTVNARHFVKKFYEFANCGAFQGPSCNANCTLTKHDHRGAPRGFCVPCGPPDVRGHRHDQTAASVLAWKLKWQLTNAPEVLIYGKPEAATDPRTLLVADGSYE